MTNGKIEEAKLALSTMNIEFTETILISAAWINCIETAEIVIQHGVKLDIRDNKWQTVLEYAIENKKRPICSVPENGWAIGKNVI